MNTRHLTLIALLSLSGCTQSDKPQAFFALGATPDHIAARSSAQVNQPQPSLPPSVVVVMPSIRPDGHGGSSADSEPLVTPPRGSSSGGAGGGITSAPPANLAEVFTTGLFRLSWLAGLSPDGPAATDALKAHMFRQVAGIAAADNGVVIVCDRSANQIISLVPTGAPVNLCGTAAGTPGFWGEDLPATASALDRPTGLARDERNGVLYVADAGNHRIRHFMPGGRIYTLAGGGSVAADEVDQAKDAALGEVHGVALDARRNVYFSESDTGRVRRVNAAGQLSTLATLTPGATGALTVTATGEKLWIIHGDSLSVLDLTVTPPTVSLVLSEDGAALTGLAYDQGSTLYVASRSAAGLGNGGSRVSAIKVASTGLQVSGHTPAIVAGSGLQSDTSADYALPATELADARMQVLAGQGPCSLGIDLSESASASVLSGILLVGNSFASQDGAVHWGQLARLEPAP